MLEPQASEAASSTEQKNKQVIAVRQEVLDALLSSPERAEAVARALLNEDGDTYTLKKGSMTIRIIVGAGRVFQGVYLKDGDYQGGITTTVSPGKNGYSAATYVPNPFDPEKGRSNVADEPKKVAEFLSRLRAPSVPAQPPV